MTSEQLVKERIANDLKDHVVTVLHADGMYRHWRCAKPGCWNMAFNIVTWPGSLCFTGDMGEFLFQRTEDMVAFMRSACMSYSYAAEKCVASKGKLKEFREEIFREVLKERIRDGVQRGEGGKFAKSTYTVYLAGGRKEEKSVKDAVDEILREYANYGTPSDAEKAMYESGLWDGTDLPSCKDYTFHFLWCLHAIHWFCEKVKGGE